jgi:hypothetical protein
LDKRCAKLANEVKTLEDAMQRMITDPRYSTTDHWIQESINQIINSGLIWAVGAVEKKNPNCHKYATFEVSFLRFHG